ncbi:MULTISPECIES: P1 family peptidase [Neobacillus]|jgi:D-aminopeptidase|uniref:P1 family peptidase n=1 Tax=Neobacillus sedimentimangrovi TaxID=2699460 RepID=A0ABS8QGC4_9BACI|nr:P1 family peptidase [Neobacillus sedimentimangrovi]AIM17077.1 D-aminopeptidase [Bacillus sp. X1(2014)]MCD4838215.1 P1 family peptidase [Neobacillus sedimentimangrovi]
MKVREAGMVIGSLPVGPKNCITDVAGVKVGHVTLDFPLDETGKDYACTGVTAILPHGGNLFKEKVTAACYVLNGFGKTTGLVQVNELGVIESPIMLTNTFGVPAVTQGTLEYMLRENPEIGETTGTINVVVGECNDSYLNSIRMFPVTPTHAIDAIKNASEQRAEEGAVGAGKGMVCFGYKGGIGSSSRLVEGYTIGCLVLSNFGRKEEFRSFQYHQREGLSETSDGSIIIVLATDAPLSDRQLARVAKRSGIGLGRTGSHFSHGSGDIVIAFSTANKMTHFSSELTEQRTQIREDQPIMNLFFMAAAEAVEEAILNSLSQAVTTSGRLGRVVYQMDFMKEGNGRCI